MTAQSLYGANVSELYMTDDELRAWNPSSMVVIRNTGTVERLRNVLPECNVFYRHWPDDNLSDVEKNIDPIKWAHILHNAVPDTEVWLVIQNEAFACPEHAEWELAVAEELLRLGRKVTVVNSGPGGPHELRYDKQRGWVVDWQSYLKKLIEFAQRYPGRVAIMLHEYIFHYDFHYGDEKFAYVDQEGVDENKYHVMKWVDDSNGRDISWYAGRFRMLLAEYTDVKIVIGEHQYDDIDWGVCKGHRQDPRNPDEPFIPDDEWITRLHIVFDRYYRPFADNIIGINIFQRGLSNGDLYGSWNTFEFMNLSNDQLMRLVDYVRIEPEEPVEITIDMDNKESVLVAPAGEYVVNIRALPNGDDLADDLTKEEVAIRTVEGQIEGSHVWRYYEFESDINAGWMAEDVLTVTHPIVDDTDDDTTDDDTEQPAPTESPTWYLSLLEAQKLYAETCAEAMRMMANAYDQFAAFCQETLDDNAA